MIGHCWSCQTLRSSTILRPNWNLSFHIIGKDQNTSDLPSERHRNMLRTVGREKRRFSEWQASAEEACFAEFRSTAGHSPAPNIVLISSACR